MTVLVAPWRGRRRRYCVQRQLYDDVVYSCARIYININGMKGVGAEQDRTGQSSRGGGVSKKPTN